nr:carboxypeptidase-like regulatory domain-containing protein [Flavobacterium sp.]
HTLLSYQCFVDVFISVSVTEQTTGKVYGNSTDINGKYKFFIPSSTYDLKVQMVNYTTLIIRNIKIGSSDVIEFNALLGQSDITSDSTVYSLQADRTFKIIPNQTIQKKENYKQRPHNMRFGVMSAD